MTEPVWRRVWAWLRAQAVLPDPDPQLSYLDELDGRRWPGD